MATNRASLQLQKLRYRWSLPSVAGVVYRVFWWEKFIPANGGSSASVVQRTADVLGTGGTVYTPVFDLPPPSAEGCTYPVPMESVLKVDIKWDGIKGGATVSGVTNTVSAGHSIRLMGSIEPSGLTPSNHQWVVAGKVIQDYYVDPDALPQEGYVIPLVNTTSQSISYYWVDGNTNTTAGSPVPVTYSCDIAGNACSATAYFDVKRPVAQIAIETGYALLKNDELSNNPLFQFGEYSYVGSTNPPGMLFENTGFYSPWGFGNINNCLWAQIIDSRYLRQITSSNSSENTIYGLDGGFPYGGSMYGGNSAEDSPVNLIGANTRSLYEDLNATMYLLFKPDPIDTGAESVPIPLRKVTWRWQGAVTNIHPTAPNWQNITNWLIETDAPWHGSDTDTTDHPTWHINSWGG